jgi:hypothetical protein
LKNAEAVHESTKKTSDPNQKNESKLEANLEIQSPEFKKSFLEMEKKHKHSQQQVEDLNAQLEAADEEAKLVDTKNLCECHDFKLVVLFPPNT